MNVPDCLRIVDEIGADRYLALDEIEAEGELGRFAELAWDVYQRSFDQFTGAGADPFFYRFDNTHIPSGRPTSESALSILVVGTGPSLETGIDQLLRMRHRVLIFTSLRGAEALAKLGVTADLVVLEHSGSLEAELSARNWSFTESRVHTDRISWIACEERTPKSMIQSLDNGRLFIPKVTGWGLWPATAVIMALKMNAERVGLLGIDLGTGDAPEPGFAPLVALLSLLASIAPNRLCDCGSAGVLKPGWPKDSLESFAPERESPSLDVLLTPRPTTHERLRDCSRLVDAMRSFIEEARIGLESAHQACTRKQAEEAESMRAWIAHMMTWRYDLQLRQQLQEGLALSFLPRLWRTGIDLSDNRRLWRPVLLCLSEVVMQYDRLHQVLADRASAEQTGTSGTGNVLPADELAPQSGPSVLVLPVTYSCNAHCRTCTIWERPKPQEVSIETLRLLVDDPSLRDHLEVVNLTGGEPFLRKDLAAFAGELSAACPNLREIGIPTNGSMPERIVHCTRTIADDLPSRATLAITVSIDGGPAMHDAVRGVPDLFDRALQTSRALAGDARNRPNLTIGINMTVTPANVSQIPVLEAIADGLGIGLTLTPAVDSDIFINSRAAQPSWSRQPTLWSEAADRLAAYGRRRGMSHLEEAGEMLSGMQQRRTPCVFWDRGLFIDVDGSVFVCPVSSQGRLGDLNSDPISRLWNSHIHRTALHHLRQTECRSCVSNCMASEANRDEVIRVIRESNRPIIIFGAGSGGRKVYERLASLGLRPHAFLDNAINNPSILHPYGIPVLSWDDGEHCRDAFTVIASATGAGQIARQLEDRGFLEGRDFASYF